jgi:hypothetical protein
VTRKKVSSTFKNKNKAFPRTDNMTHGRSVTTAKVFPQAHTNSKSSSPKRSDTRVKLPSASATSDVAHPARQPQTFPPAPTNTWGTIPNPHPIVTTHSKHDPVARKCITTPYSPNSVLPSNSFDRQTKPVDCCAFEPHSIIPSNPEKYTIYEEMLAFMLKFDALTVPIKLRIFDEFTKVPNLDALRQCLLHHIVNHNTWHLSKTERWSSDLDYNISYKIKGISVSMSVINANPILFWTFHQLGKQSGSHSLNEQPDRPTIPIPTSLRCDFCGCIDEAKVAVAEYDLNDHDLNDPETLFPTPFESDHFAYVATVDEENPPDIPPILGILTPMQRVVTCGYARAIEPLTPALEESQDEREEEKSADSDPFVTTPPVPIAADLPPLVPIDDPNDIDGIEHIILPTIAPSDTNDLTDSFDPIDPQNNATNATTPPQEVPDIFASDPVDTPIHRSSPPL